MVRRPQSLPGSAAMVALLFAATLATSCDRRNPASTDADLTNTFDTVAGVIHVANSGTPARWELTPVVSIGPKSLTETGGAPDEFGRVSAVALGPDETVFVADALNHEVRVFGLDGAHVRTFGREGQGPGEFRSLYSLAWVGDRLLTFDPRQGRIGEFSGDGQWLGQRQTAGGWTGSPALLRFYPVGPSEVFRDALSPDLESRWVGHHSTGETGDTLSLLSVQTDRLPGATPGIMCEWETCGPDQPELPRGGASRFRAWSQLRTSRPPSVTACRKTASLALIPLAIMSCDPVAGPEAAAIRLAPFASSEAPLSVNAYVALATDDTACVLNDYETQVHCVYRGGEQADVFGRPGGGPGEFQTRPRSVTRGPDGTLAVIGYNWVVLFEPSGRFVADVRVPLTIRLSASADSVLMGSQLEIDRPSRVINTRHLEVDVATGEILWEGYFPASMAAQADCPPRVSSSGRSYPTLGSARRFPSGGMVFFALCRGQLLFLSHLDDKSGIVMQPPLYTLEYPTRRDVERYLEACESPASRVLGIPCEVERFRRTPKHYGIHYWVDDQDRLWVLTDRDREEYSYLDVYAGPQFSGSVRVRHRAVGFDVLGPTLAVLVDRPVGPDDPDGISDRGIDWYDIEGLEFGKLPSSER